MTTVHAKSYTRRMRITPRAILNARPCVNLRLTDYKRAARVNTTYDAFPAQVVEETFVLLRGQKQGADICHPPLGRVAAHVDGTGGG